MNFLSRLIAFRYLFSSRQRFVPLLAGVAMGGVALGVWSLMVVLSVMRGFQNELNDRWIGLNAHLTVSMPLDGVADKKISEVVRQWPEVLEASSFMDGEVIVQADRQDDSQSAAVKIRGVEFVSPSFLKKVQIYPESVDDWRKLSDNDTPPLIGGHELMATLGLHPDMEETVTVIYPLAEIGPTGDFVPRQKTFELTHLFKSGLYDWDSMRILVPLWTAKGLLGNRGESGVLVYLKNISDLETVEKKLKILVGEKIKVASFAEQNKRLFAALKLERLAMSSFLILFGLIASFSITGLLLMYVDSKRRDLAILKTCGLSPAQARGIFLSLGGILGGTGALVGGSLGVITCFILQTFPIALPATYYLDYLPVQMRPIWMLVVFVLGFLLALVSSLYPVWVASRMEVLPMLREE